MYSTSNPPRTQIGQRVGGYKTTAELAEGEQLADLVLDSPDGKLYYQCFAEDLTPDPSNPCDLWRTADHALTARISRRDGCVVSLAFPSED